MASMLYSLIRIVLDAIATSHHNEAKLRAEVLALRQQVQVLERQIKRVRWEPADRMILAALRERLPRSAWAALLVQPETVLGWHRELVRRRWAAYRGRPRTGRPPLAEPVRELIVRMARENPRWGYFRIRGELLKLGFTVSATTVRSVLRRSHVPPAGRIADELASVPDRACRELGGDRLLHRRHRVLQTPLCALLRASGDPSRGGCGLYSRTEFGLGGPAGSQSELEAKG